jgi:hypothetical protein
MTAKTIIGFSRLYSALLLLYPARFRVRFGEEMQQVFKDCCESEIQRNSLIGLCRVWFHTLTDFSSSLGREWRRELVLVEPEIDYTGLADSFIVTVVVGTILLGWGWVAAVFVLNITTPHIFEYYASLATILAVVVTISMAALIGMLSALIVGRSGRPERNRIRV